MKRIIYLLLPVFIAIIVFPHNAGAARNIKKAKYVFYFIGDGMGMNQVNGAEMFMAEKEGRIGTKPLNFTQFPSVGYATTFSAYNSVTCSAAAGTALATGEKTKNGTIGMDKGQQNPLHSIAVIAQRQGKKVGIATNNSIDHATPACFYAHQKDRNMFYPIVTDLVKSGFDYFAGAGFLEIVSKTDSLAPDVFTVLQDNGYSVVRGYDDFRQKYPDAGKIVFIQKEDKNKDMLPYAIDRTPDDMTLEEITRGAIDFLGKDRKNGFFMMVECGSIDWACHINDAATVFNEVIDFQNAIERALDFYRQHPDETLIVVTADHETGGLGLGTGAYELNLKVLSHQKVSKTELSKRISTLREKNDHFVSWEEIKQLLSDNLGLWSVVEVSEQCEKELKEQYDKAFKHDDPALVKSLYAEDQPLASKGVDILNRIARVGWLSGGHSAGYVPVFAIGCGAVLFTGKMDNTDIPHKIKEAMTRNIR